MAQKLTLLNIQDKRFRGLALISLGIATAVVAQITLYFSVHRQDIAEYFRTNHWVADTWNNTSPILGVFLYVAACALYITGAHYFGERQPEAEIFSGKEPQHEPRFGFWLSSLGLSGVVAVILAQESQDKPIGLPLAGLWILSILLFVASVMLDQHWRPPSRQAMKAWLTEHRGEVLLVAIITLSAFFIRFIDVEGHPYSFINDEGQLGSIGLCILQGKCTSMFALEGWSGQPYLAFVPYAISIAIFGKTALAMRIVSVITGTFAVAATYLVAREAFGKKVAWVAALLLVALPLHLQFSRLGVDNIIDSLSAPLLLWLLIRGVKRGSTTSFVAAGLIAGLCLYTYPGSLLAAALGVILIGGLVVARRGFLGTHGRNILFFILAALVIALPLVGSFASNPDIFLGRFKGEGIFLNGAIQNEMDSSGRSAATIILTQFAKSTLVFIATPASTGFINSPDPYLIPLAAIFFMLGLAWLLWQIKDYRSLLLFVWLAAPIILGSTLTDSPPSSQRMLMTTPALVIIVALGALKAFEAMRHITPAVSRFIPVILLGLVIYTGLANLNFYFNAYRNGHTFEDPANEFAYETRKDIMPLGDQGRFYLIADPGIAYLSFPDFSFFDSDVESSEFNTITRQALADLPRDKDALFIATPDYKLSLQQIQQWIPNGVWQEVRRRYQPIQTLYYSYKIKKEQLEGFTP